ARLRLLDIPRVGVVEDGQEREARLRLVGGLGGRIGDGLRKRPRLHRGSRIGRVRRRALAPCPPDGGIERGPPKLSEMQLTSGRAVRRNRREGYEGVNLGVVPSEEVRRIRRSCVASPDTA